MFHYVIFVNESIYFFEDSLLVTLVKILILHNTVTTGNSEALQPKVIWYLVHKLASVIKNSIYTKQLSPDRLELGVTSTKK